MLLAGMVAAVLMVVLPVDPVDGITWTVTSAMTITCNKTVVVTPAADGEVNIDGITRMTVVGTG